MGTDILLSTFPALINFFPIHLFSGKVSLCHHLLPPKGWDYKYEAINLFDSMNNHVTPLVSCKNVHNSSLRDDTCLLILSTQAGLNDQTWPKEYGWSDTKESRLWVAYMFLEHSQETHLHHGTSPSLLYSFQPIGRVRGCVCDLISLNEDVIVRTLWGSYYLGKTSSDIILCTRLPCRQKYTAQASGDMEAVGWVTRWVLLMMWTECTRGAFRTKNKWQLSELRHC